MTEQRAPYGDWERFQPPFKSEDHAPLKHTSDFTLEQITDLVYQVSLAKPEIVLQAAASILKRQPELKASLMDLLADGDTLPEDSTETSKSTENN